MRGSHARSPDARRWTFRQKQTGADNFSLGGSLSANIHGRGLAMPPFVADIESFTMIDAHGELRHCSRTHNRDWFALAVGGYGLFGVVLTMTLRLSRRQRVERVVRMCDASSLLSVLRERIAQGCIYGDFQFAIDADDEGFLDRGIVSCYRPVAADGPLPRGQRSLSEREWQRLLWLAHRDKRAAFDAFASFYLATTGQHYGSDDHQLGYYLDGYHALLDDRLGHRGSEMIGELYVPRLELVAFLRGAASDLRRHRVDVVYGTVRLIERDTETFLPWAREAYACVVLNLHTPHDREGIARTSAAFRRLIDLAASLRGSYYLTYHRYASRAQVEACHPKFAEFLAVKQRLDPRRTFDSDWHRHYARLFDATRREPSLSAARMS